jgi:hypothetical protein
MFRALLACPQEAPHKRHLVYCVRIMSVGCATITVSLLGYAVAQLVEALCYKPEGRGFDSLWCHRNVSLT